MQMGKKMWYHKRDLMHLDKDMGHSSRFSIEVRAWVGWIVGNVLRRTLGYIDHRIKV